MALYHAIIGSDGKATEIVAGRPIGFGLDEGAVDAIRKARFQPAIKDGKPVPVVLDLVVSFRIYSNRTSQPAVQENDSQAQPVLPAPTACSPSRTRGKFARFSARQSQGPQCAYPCASGRAGSHSSTRLLSGSQIHAKRP